MLEGGFRVAAGSLACLTAVYVNCRAAAADSAYHHLHSDADARSSEETPVAAAIPHDGGARPQTIHNAQGHNGRK